MERNVDLADVNKMVGIVNNLRQENNAKIALFFHSFDSQCFRN